MVINDLSKEVGTTNRELISYLKSAGFKVSSHLQTATEEMADKAREHFVKVEDGARLNDGAGKDPAPAAGKPARKAVSKPARKIALDEYITCKSVTPWRLVLVSVDGHVVYEWDHFGAEEDVMYRDLQSWRKKEIITAPQIIIEDEDIREAWKQDMTETYKALVGVEYPEELFDMEDSEFEAFLREASPLIREVVKATAISMIHNQNYPSLSKILAVDEILKTDLKDFLVK